MKKWYQWLYLSLIFAFGGVLNYIDRKQTIASAIQVGITLALALIQFLCDKKGEKGKKLFNYISMVIITLLIIWTIYLVLSIWK